MLERAGCTRAATTFTGGEFRGRLGEPGGVVFSRRKRSDTDNLRALIFAEKYKILAPRGTNRGSCAGGKEMVCSREDRESQDFSAGSC